jgi:hypothetical protein
MPRAMTACSAVPEVSNVRAADISNQMRTVPSSGSFAQVGRGAQTQLARRPIAPSSSESPYRSLGR